MGLGSEYLADHAFEMDYPFGLPSKTWKTRDGREIRIQDRADPDIDNIEWLCSMVHIFEKCRAGQKDD